MFSSLLKSPFPNEHPETDLDTLRLLEETEIAKHSKNLRFFILFVFGFACFQLVVIFVDFQIPLGTQLVQNGMKMVPNTDPLGCFLIQFRPTLPKKNTTHNTTNLFFRNLGPKTRFPFTL